MAGNTNLGDELQLGLLLRRLARRGLSDHGSARVGRRPPGHFSLIHFFSSVSAEVFLRRSFRHPPTLFPMVSIPRPIRENCLVGINLASQQYWMKKRKESIVSKDLSNSGIFKGIDENEAFRKKSKRSINKWSIFWPKPKRSHWGKFRWIESHCL